MNKVVAFVGLSFLAISIPLVSAEAQSGTLPPSYKRSRDAFQRNDLATAVTEMEKAVAAAPDNPETNAWMGFLLIRAGDPDRALRHLETANRSRRDVPETCTNLANALLLRKSRTTADTRRAIELLETAIAKQPTAADSYNSLGFAAWKIGDFRKAVNAYRGVVRLRPNDAQAHVNLGLSFQKIGKDAEAADALRKGSSLDPGNLAAWTALGRVEARLGRHEGAVVALEAARRLEPGNIETLTQLAYSNSRLGRDDEAQRLFGAAADAAVAEGAPAAVRNDASARYNQGVLLARLDRLPEALQAYERALAINPRYYDALVNAGFVEYRTGQFDKAAARFGAAVKLRPTVGLGWKNLALALEKIAVNAETVDAWRKAAESDPSDYESREHLGAALVTLKKDAEALPVYEAMAKLRPKSGLAHNAIGLIHLRAGRLDPALTAFSEAVDREPGFAPAHNNIGVLHERKGRINAAIAAYRKALAADPSFADAKANLARFGSTTVGNKAEPMPAKDKP